jgi:hypothetical protein
LVERTGNEVVNLGATLARRLVATPQAQRRHRVLGIAGEVVPPLQGGEAETQRQTRDRVPPASRRWTRSGPVRPILRWLAL